MSPRSVSDDEPAVVLESGGRGEEVYSVTPQVQVRPLCAPRPGIGNSNDDDSVHNNNIILLPRAPHGVCRGFRNLFPTPLER